MSEDNAPCGQIDSTGAFLHTYAAQWREFAHAYVEPPELPYAATGYRMAVDRVLGDSRVYRYGAEPKDLDLLLEMAFDCASMQEFLNRHLAAGIGPSDSAYRHFRQKIEWAASALSNYVVHAEDEDRETRLPMLREVEKALLEKWYVFRDESVMAHPFMQGRDLSDAVHCKGEPREATFARNAMRAEIMNTRQGDFFHHAFIALYESTLRSTIMENMHSFMCYISSLRGPKSDSLEAATDLCRHAVSHLGSSLFTYNTRFSDIVPKQEGDENRQAGFSTLLKANLGYALGHAIRDKKAERGLSQSVAAHEGRYAKLILGTVSLDAPLNGNGTKEYTLSHMLSSVKNDHEKKRVQQRAILLGALDELLAAHAITRRNYEIFCLRKLEYDHTLEEVSEAYDITSARVRQIECGVIEKLSKKILPLGEETFWSR